MKDFIAGVTALALGVFFIFLCRDIPLLIARGYPGPSFFPLILSVVSIICGVILMIKSIIRLRGSKGFTSVLRITPLIRRFKDREVLNAVRFIVMTVAYIVLIPYLGFLLTSLIYMLLVQVVYGVSTFKALGISVSMVFFIYILFIGILKVVVPEPILGSIVFR
jgi:hypothetical protein